MYFHCRPSTNVCIRTIHLSLFYDIDKLYYKSASSLGKALITTFNRCSVICHSYCIICSTFTYFFFITNIIFVTQSISYIISNSCPWIISKWINNRLSCIWVKCSWLNIICFIFSKIIMITSFYLNYS